MQANYVFTLLNHSKENRNYDVLASLDYPQRFGFPVILILDANGKLIHTQNSAYLEKDKSYDEKKMIGFLQNWSPAALDPANYKAK